ncbi:hypothetical protein AAD027_15725 [Pseudoxanthomonas putridarboris]|uniref:Uncharacterized protein n=2 Tax=Pseudoxanthomonas putridarboris TaxID=752605 RepID=A0ABU9J4K8_9GAMM
MVFSAAADIQSDAHACCTLADGTPVVLELLDPISSARSQRGGKFRLKLQESVVVDGVTVLPAGTEGMGEIVHAERSRGGGKPGELILTARYLRLGDRTIKLRSFKLGGSGRDTSHIAIGAAVAIGPFAQFIHGKEIEIPAHASGSAKLAETVQLPAAPDAAPDFLDAAPASEPDPDPPQTIPEATQPSNIQE